MSASMPPRTHALKFTHAELRALVAAVDHVVYPADGRAKVGIEHYRLLTVLHERLWEHLAARSPEDIADAMVRSNDG